MTEPDKITQEKAYTGPAIDIAIRIWDYACNLWKSLKVYVSDSRNQRKVVLGFGREDKFADQCRVLADALLAEQVFTVPGGHDWATWKKLWIKAADYFLELKIQRERQSESRPR
jgi:enterochelin esterase-like enzyme